MDAVRRIRVNDSLEFDYQQEFSLLDALEARAVPVLHSCRGGYCGCCKVRLSEGRVSWHLDSLVPLQDDEILCCCCTPLTAIAINVPEC